MNLIERLEEAFEKKVGGTAMLPASDVLSASVELQRQEERIRALEALTDRLKQEAQIHAQEARTANATIAEIYQAVTGSTGEPGNWNGARPVVEKLRALEAHNAVLLEALETTHDLYAHASSGYGFARPDNPHSFSPDPEWCSPEEIAAHSKACEDYDAGRKISDESWGIGTYCDEYTPALIALASTPEQSLSSIRRAERERCAQMAESFAYMSENFNALAEEIRKLED